MMQPEILWSTEEQTDPLHDLKRFVRSLDFYEISVELDGPNARYVYLSHGGYDITTTEKSGAFRCPHCGADKFDVVVGDFQGKPALGLWCKKCETYGAVFPKGM